MIRLLISSAGRRVELINCFRKAAEELQIELEIFAIDMNPEWSPACNIADYAYRVPHCKDEGFLDIVSGICDQHRINLIIPTIDTELLFYAGNRERFVRNGIEIMVSDSDFVAIARDKMTTAAQFKVHGIESPNTWGLDCYLYTNCDVTFPLILKPRDGSCSAGIAIVESKKALEALTVDPGNYILQELCYGREFTINAFYNRDGKCVSCVPHFRKLVRAGEVCFAETVRIPEFKSIAQKLGTIFPGIWGAICFQGFYDDKESVQVFEINARFGGGYPVCDRAGGTFARWILQDLDGQSPDYHDNWCEGVRMLRYDAAVFT